ncbi:hypothetical protein C2G38_2160489 [Gigaspora rosea]|uniref:Uncharacterized protein n=1 Tax=Gigaspora rosea TaxID=44941 RepID=A0A397W027_9GLOM|nr:hypothetical protein C2G38_2160489 [Gigaspora rosea]
MGNGYGIYDLRCCYQHRICIEKEKHKVLIHQKSSEMGNATATSNFGCCNEYGIGIEKDEHKAFIHLLSKICRVGIYYRNVTIAYIANLRLSIPTNRSLNAERPIYGVLPYIAQDIYIYSVL